MRFLERAWYFAEWSTNVGPEKPLGLVIAGKPIALYRAEAGQLVALGDRCPHRFAPLHLGKVQGSALECPYHGLRFAAGGRCVFSPHHEGAVPGVIHVPAYTVAERDGAVWVWLSQDAPADESLIPDMSALGSYPAESRMSYRTLVNADYQLIVDNLLDATHADFVHAGMLGNGAFTRVKPAVTVRGNTVFAEWVNRRTIAVPQLTPFLQDPNPDNLESWIVIRWNAPGVVRLEFGTSRLGGNREDGPRVVAYHIMMPREDGTSNYEVAAVRNYGYEDPVISSRINQSVAFAFEQQDKPIIEAQQRMMGGLDFWDLKPLLLRADGAAVQARRKLKAMIEAETAPSRPEQTAGAPSPVEVASR